jgi:hypothetical protein
MVTSFGRHTHRPSASVKHASEFINSSVAVFDREAWKMAERKLLRPKAVDEIYDISEGHQAKMRCSGNGPEYIKLGSKIYYEEAAIERWLSTKRRTSTSDPGPALHEEDAAAFNSEKIVRDQPTAAPSVVVHR